MIVPQPPGGGFDSVWPAAGRPSAVQPELCGGEPPGLGTLVGTDLAAKATPDGYTLLVGSVSNLALNMGLYPNLPYDSLRDFETLGLCVSYSYTLMARKDPPFRSLREVVDHASGPSGKAQLCLGRQRVGASVIAAALWHRRAWIWCMCPYRGAVRPTRICWADGWTCF